MSRLFGTDGVRGRVGTELTADLALRLGRAAGGYFLEHGARLAVVARDTRLSGEMIGGAFIAGAASVGVHVTDLEIAPTAAVSVILSTIVSPPIPPDPSRSLPTSAFGAVISASHNPYEDNGIKLFSPDGSKLSTGEEEAIERRLKTSAELDASDDAVGRIQNKPELLQSYIDSLRARFSVRLSQTRLVIDAAHGAWAPHVRALFDGAAPDIVYLNDQFTGTDINANCGSTHVNNLDPHLDARSVGIAFDGDGDRCLIRVLKTASEVELLTNRNSKTVKTVNTRPRCRCLTLDGDALMLLFARHLEKAGPVVGTVMSNGFLAAAIETMNRPFVRAPVGDREVCDRMTNENAGIGGEQSGHIIFRSFQKTGDGAVTALAFLTVLATAYGESLDRLVAGLPEPFPQKLVNIRVTEKRPWEDDHSLSDAVRRAQDKLGKHGRLVIRYSGTEPLLRIMAEAPSVRDVEEQVAFLVERFRSRLN